jgi:hypothetical protein
MRYLIIFIIISLALASCGDDKTADLLEQYDVDLTKPVTVIASTDVEEATIGDKIRYTITVISDPDLKITVPPFGEHLGSFGIKDFGRSSPRDYKGKVVEEQWYVLDIYVTGIYTIPPPVVKYKDADGKEIEVEGGEVNIEIKSVIPDSEEPEDIMDIAAPVNLPVDYKPYIYIGVGILVLVGAGITTYILLRRREWKMEEAPPKAAHEIAYEQLQEIANANLIETGKIERYYVLLSATVRYYLENRFGLHAPEMTTEEFLYLVSKATGDDALIQDHRNLLQDFLTECDLVKFARYGPDEEQMQTAFVSAKRFVDETRADLIAVEAETLPSGVSDA